MEREGLRIRETGWRMMPPIAIAGCVVLLTIAGHEALAWGLLIAQSFVALASWAGGQKTR
jgi:hypothetical protein